MTYARVVALTALSGDRDAILGGIAMVILER
jgi:hypothetical protein